MNRFTIQAEKWYAMELIGDGFDCDKSHYSPIYINSVTGLKTGGSILEIDFFHVAYPAGVQDKIYRIKVFARGREFILGKSIEHSSIRLMKVYPVSPAWLRVHFHADINEGESPDSWLFSHYSSPRRDYDLPAIPQLYGLPDPDDMDELLEYLSIFYADGFEPTLLEPGPGGYPVYVDELRDFYKLVTKPCWRDPFYDPWTLKELMKKSGWIEKATLNDIISLLTYCARSDKFCTGFQAGMIRDGTLQRILQRLKSIRDQQTR